MKLFKILESLGKEDLTVSETSNRRETLVNVTTKTGKAVLAAAIPAGILAANNAQGQVVNRTQDAVLDVLNFALKLEYLESAFYNKAFNTTGFSALMGSDVAVFQQIQKHENSHVNFLKATITSLYGSGNYVAMPTGYDWTAAGTFQDPFATLSYSSFLALSQAFEDTGVRAYKGGAVTLQANLTVLDAALQIHTVEARHASEVRRIRNQKGWITQSNTDISGTAGNYGAGTNSAVSPAESNTIQGGVDVLALSSSMGVTSNAATESFDEPLDSAKVLSLVGPFIIP